jgi:hypothetical protein
VAVPSPAFAADADRSPGFQRRRAWRRAASIRVVQPSRGSENPRAHYLLATAQVRIGMNDYAIKNFKEAIA